MSYWEKKYIPGNNKINRDTALDFCQYADKRTADESKKE
jgi:hypothetical protein